MTDRIFHGCMRKNSDGTNRIIEKNFICLFGKEPETLILGFARALKRPGKILLRDQTLIDIADAEAVKTLRDGCLQTRARCMS